MKLVIQRVLHSSVSVDRQVVSEIKAGLMILVGVHSDDEERDAEYLAEKISGLRIFEDQSGKMNFSIKEHGGTILAVPQFTLLGDCRRGRRPDFTQAARPEKGKILYQHFCKSLEKAGVTVAQGCFQEHMHVELINDGPVTIILDSKKWNN